LGLDRLGVDASKGLDVSLESEGLGISPDLVCTDSDLDIVSILEMTSSEVLGGVSIFVGRPRSNGAGSQTLGLFYDVYEEGLRAWLSAAVTKLTALYGAPLKCIVAQRTGMVPLGEPAVIVATAAPRRAEAIRSCADLVEGLKYQSPIFKAECLENGDRIWVVAGGQLNDA